MRLFQACDTIFGDFCDENIRICAVSGLLPVANLSSEMALATLISYKTEDACKPAINKNLSKLIKDRKLNYAHVRKSFPVTSPKELVLFLGKMNLSIKFD